MDEPLSNLDAALRVKMRTELLKLHRELGITVLYVTHDQTEALTMGDRVAVLHQGRLQQVAPPRELYERPANRFVAAFIGSPAMNFITCRLSRSTDELTLEVAGRTHPLPQDFLDEHPELIPFLEQPVILGVRPEHLGPPRPLPGPPALRLRGAVEVVETLGPVNSGSSFSHRSPGLRRSTGVCYRCPGYYGSGHPGRRPGNRLRSETAAFLPAG
jgi:multiple sugar transport system ATP-binding protein